MTTRDRLRQAVMALPPTPCLPLGEWAGAVELLLPVVEQIAAERAAEAVASVRLIHASDGAGTPFCEECGHTWPCLTTRALDDARAAGLTDKDERKE